MIDLRIVPTSPEPWDSCELVLAIDHQSFPFRYEGTAKECQWYAGQLVKAFQRAGVKEDEIRIQDSTQG